jgi:hypothetical protein
MAGKKTFVAGEVLLAQDVNDLLMDQTIMNFASSAARSSAIPTPTEGMFTVTTDNDQVDYYNGSNWVPALPIGAWQTWAPTLSGGWANGNGIWDAKYVQIGKTVHFTGEFTIGSTTTKGNNLVFSLPVVSKDSYNFSFHAFCSPNALLIAHRLSVTTGTVLAVNAAGTYAIRATVTSTVPVTWATGQLISINGTYEAA